MKVNRVRGARTERMRELIVVMEVAIGCDGFHGVDDVEGCGGCDFGDGWCVSVEVENHRVMNLEEKDVRRRMFIDAPATCRSKSPNGEMIERT